MSEKKQECPGDFFAKTMIAGASSVVLLMLTILVGAAWTRSDVGAIKATELEPRVAVLEAAVSSINRDTSRITKVTEDIQRDVKELLGYRVHQEAR